MVTLSCPSPAPLLLFPGRPPTWLLTVIFVWGHYFRTMYIHRSVSQVCFTPFLCPCSQSDTSPLFPLFPMRPLPSPRPALSPRSPLPPLFPMRPPLPPVPRCPPCSLCNPPLPPCSPLPPLVPYATPSPLVQVSAQVSEILW